MNKVLLAALLVLSSVVLKAQDAVFPYFNREDWGTWLVSFQPVILPEASSDYMPLLRVRRGLAEELALTGKLGLNGSTVYAGADVRYVWVPAIENLQVETAAGMQYFDRAGLKFAGVASYRFEKVYGFTGLDYQPWFRKDGIGHAVVIPAGAGVPLLKNRLLFVFETGIPLTSAAQPFQSVSFGLTWRLR